MGLEVDAQAMINHTTFTFDIFSQGYSSTCIQVTTYEVMTDILTDEADAKRGPSGPLVFLLRVFLQNLSRAGHRGTEAKI